jgi:hypothetical protein
MNPTIKELFDALDSGKTLHDGSRFISKSGEKYYTCCDEPNCCDDSQTKEELTREWEYWISVGEKLHWGILPKDF